MVRGWQTSSAKGKKVNILRFAGHSVSVATANLCPVKAARDNT